jgi:hypothetical protein
LCGSGERTACSVTEEEAESPIAPISTRSSLPCICDTAASDTAAAEGSFSIQQAPYSSTVLLAKTGQKLETFTKKATCSAWPRHISQLPVGLAESWLLAFAFVEKGKETGTQKSARVPTEMGTRPMTETET